MGNRRFGLTIGKDNSCKSDAVERDEGAEGARFLVEAMVCKN